jgi:hypothetical protein
LIFDLWRWYQRTFDLRVLWPQCKAQARDLDHAKAAFALHAFNNPAWLRLGEDEIKIRIDALD